MTSPDIRNSSVSEEFAAAERYTRRHQVRPTQPTIKEPQVRLTPTSHSRRGGRYEPVPTDETHLGNEPTTSVLPEHQNNTTVPVASDASDGALVDSPFAAAMKAAEAKAVEPPQSKGHSKKGVKTSHNSPKPDTKPSNNNSAIHTDKPEPPTYHAALVGSPFDDVNEETGEILPSFQIDFPCEVENAEPPEASKANDTQPAVKEANEITSTDNKQETKPQSPCAYITLRMDGKFIRPEDIKPSSTEALSPDDTYLAIPAEYRERFTSLNDKTETGYQQRADLKNLLEVNSWSLANDVFLRAKQLTQPPVFAPSLWTFQVDGITYIPKSGTKPDITLPKQIENGTVNITDVAYPLEATRDTTYGIMFQTSDEAQKWIATLPRRIQDSFQVFPDKKTNPSYFAVKMDKEASLAEKRHAASIAIRAIYHGAVRYGQGEMIVYLPSSTDKNSPDLSKLLNTLRDYSQNESVRPLYATYVQFVDFSLTADELRDIQTDRRYLVSDIYVKEGENKRILGHYILDKNGGVNTLKEYFTLRYFAPSITVNSDERKITIACEPRHAKRIRKESEWLRYHFHYEIVVEVKTEPSADVTRPESEPHSKRVIYKPEPTEKPPYYAVPYTDEDGILHMPFTEKNSQGSVKLVGWYAISPNHVERPESTAPSDLIDYVNQVSHGKAEVVVRGHQIIILCHDGLSPAVFIGKDGRNNQALSKHFGLSLNVESDNPIPNRHQPTRK